MESHTELVLFGLLLAVAVLAVVARWIRVPYPILLVLGGSALGFAPGMPDVKLDPDLVLLIFLPPLLYSAAFFANLHELRRNAGSIGLLAFGLVLATMGAVAVVAHHAIGLSWAVAFTLGAVVAPTDAVAPIDHRAPTGRPPPRRHGDRGREPDQRLDGARPLPLRRRGGGDRQLLAGRGRPQVPAHRPGWLRHRRSAWGGSSPACASAWTTRLPRSRSPCSPATRPTSRRRSSGVSGVIAAVTVGVYMGSQTSRLTTPTVRMQGFAVWEILQFLLNAFLFVLIGLQLPAVLDGLQRPARPASWSATRRWSGPW